ncbi:TPA: fibronectin binding protein [Streptococcus pyogenes]|nr:fibronectin binding protein [Streptococcus pyogenes]HER4600274.1 fibronectin binding protein [Streptococcus pyogenes NGAS625]HER4628863.1 fibronectin binding protein [Streptococcus pyogenes NGAS599]HER4699644.1 fibronectin binding protein [Streptococcus pyogenes NGAS322]HEP1299269.1 fibronectin binding protein [Streptococcus pyogenes]
MLIAPTVLGQEVGVSSTESSTTSTASASTDTSGTAVSEAGSGASDASVVSSEGSQSSESAQASTQPQAQTATATSSSSSNTNGSSSNSGDSDVKAPKAVTSSTSPSTPAVASSDGNQATGTEVETPMMEVEQYTVDNKATELNIKDGKNLKNGSRVDKNTKLIRNRDDEQRDIVDIKREVKTNADGTIDVTVTVTPKEIDKGADVMALLDVSKKMTEDDFKNAKDKIKKLVTTLTSRSASNSDNDEHKHNSRNSVRLMTFYRKVNEPIQLTAENVDKTLDEVWKKAKEDWNWGVDLQGAIHKAREIFNKEKEKKSGKRQHIVLFSQGESTFSYDIKNKNDRIVTKTRITEKVTTSNPLLPGLPIFNHTNQKADMLDDIAKVIKKIKDLGVKSVDTADSVLSALRALNGFGSLLTGSMTEYITLKEYDSDKLEEKYFDYTKRAGEGYYYHSFSDRKSENKMPFENELQALLGTYVPKLQDQEWIKKFLDYWDLTEKAEQTKLNIIMKVIKSIFYKREYHYYNHNLSAIAEAKMAQKEGITFYSVDVTDSDKASKRVKRQVGNEQSKKKKEDAEKDRNEKFDNYLKKMSEGDNFLSNVEERDKFKDTLTKLTIKDEFDGKVSVDKTSYQSSSAINYSEARNGFWSPSKESLTWTISKEQLKEAFEKNSSLTFKYKLRVNKNKLLGTDKKTTKRDTPTEDKTSVTAKIISNTTTYKINDQEVKDNKLDDVSLTYSKFKVPVPQIDGHVIEPQAPKLPELPPVTERGPVLDYTEESIYRLPLEHGSNAPDTQVTIEEDTVPQRPDILVGGQSDPIDITEDTQPGMSGSNDATVVEEDTVPKRPDILVGGQSDPIDITEDTQPGMSGSNDATVIEEDTKPKRFFHFDNEPQAPEKPKEQPSLSLPQAPVYKAAHHLPASGDKREASFTIVALTFIGAAGLLSKKRRDTEEN